MAAAATHRLNTHGGTAGFIANTDFGWFSYFLHCAEQPDEVDFWQPSPHGFRAIPPGAPFFFRLGAPHKAIAGYGFFARDERVPVWLAWDSFADLNGTDTFAEMTARIEAIRRRTGSALLTRPQDYEVGCIMSEFAGGVLRLRRLGRRPRGLASPHPGRQDHRRRARRRAARPRRVPGAHGAAQAGGRAARRRAAPLRRAAHGPATPRPGHLPHRRHQCLRRLRRPRASTRCPRSRPRTCVPTRTAAHTRSPTACCCAPTSTASCDAGYVTVTPDYRFRVSHDLADDFHNGREYERFAGRAITVLPVLLDQPDPELLDWHAAEVFTG